MDNLSDTAVATSAATVQPIGTISNLASASGANTVSIAPLPGVAHVVGTPVPTISQVWYNCNPDGVGPSFVAANGQTLQVDLTNEELTRQLNQQLQTPYGNIQVQVQQVTDHLLAQKPEEEVKVKRVRQNGNERVACPTCGKTVSCNATLRDHMRTHTGERPFVCGECGLAFAQRSNLRMHKRLHTGERPYMCGICGKTFARSSHLPAHMRTHTGEKPYVCQRCNHAFITAQQLKNHFRVHTGEKPWKCDMCDAAFTHSSSLSTHKKKHTGHKPYECEKCQKCFFFTSALDKHMKVHSKARPFSCDNCGKAFKYKESLTVHVDKYCGKEILKRPRGPRRPDARKPGPKPGTGRKYIQKRKGRPRGRPRKRKRWSERISIKTPKDYKHMQEFGEMDIELLAQGAENPNKKIKQDIDGEKLLDEEHLDEEEGEFESDEEMSENIPTAELKVEVISPDELHLTENVKQEITVAAPATSEISSTQPEQIHSTPALSTEIMQLSSENEIRIDENTPLTIVSAEEAEQHIASGGVQLFPVQFVPHEGQDGQIMHQLITREGIQMWCQKQFP